MKSEKLGILVEFFERRGKCFAPCNVDAAINVDAVANATHLPHVDDASPVVVHSDAS
jgi:hypothetical protein